MKRLIVTSGFLFILLITACSVNKNSQPRIITEGNQTFLPLINDSATVIEPDSGDAAVKPTMPDNNPDESQIHLDSDLLTPAIPALGQNSQINSTLFPYKGVLQIPIPYGYTREIDKSYPYGSTQEGTRIPHDGVEFYNAGGTPVIAAADGLVYYAGTDDQTSFGQFKNFYGNLIIIEHNINNINYPIFSLYAHLSAINVNTGDEIKQGEKIGEVGSTGSAIGSHLHFEVRINSPELRNRVNPLLYLALNNQSSEKQSGILIGKIIDNEQQLVSQNKLVIQFVEEGQIRTEKAYYLETYASGVPLDPNWQENFVISNLPPGNYRVSVFIQNQFVEKFIVIENNFLTLVTLSSLD